MTPGESGSVEIGSSLPADAGIGGDGTLGGSLVHLAGCFGPRTALVTPAGRWTYSELVDLATTVARALLARGAAPGDHIGVLMPNSAEWVAATFGAALMGAVPVPMSRPLGRARAGGGLYAGRRALPLGRLGGRRARSGRAPRCPQPQAGRRRPGGDHRRRPPSDGRGPLLLRAAHRRGPPGRRAAGRGGGGAARGRRRRPGRRRTGRRRPDPVHLGNLRGAQGGPPWPHRPPLLQPTVWARMQAISTDERIFSTYPFCWSSGFARSLMAALSVGACMVTIDHFEPGAALELMEGSGSPWPSPRPPAISTCD